MALLVEIFPQKNKRLNSRIRFTCDDCGKEVVVCPPEAKTEQEVLSHVAKNLPKGWRFKDEISYCFGCSCEHELAAMQHGKE
jgi:hypothetical protein